MREPHDGSLDNPGWGWPGVAISLLCALVGAVLVVSGMVGAALAGLSGSRPQSAPFLAGVGFGGVAILAAVVSWLGTSRPAV